MKSLSMITSVTTENRVILFGVSNTDHPKVNYSERQKLKKQSSLRFNEYDHLLKFLVIGDAEIGKSAYLKYLKDGEYLKSYVQTIGVDFCIISLVHSNRKIYKLQIWDTRYYLTCYIIELNF